MNKKMIWLVVVIFAAAMAWVESAVVVYLRTLIDRVEPYQTNPLPVSVGLSEIELVREAATLVMLFTVGWLAGQTWRNRLSYAFIAFGTWDILYYVFLIPMTGWPRSLFDWDILFLLPLPWWGPVIAPVSIALLMIIGGTITTQFDTPLPRLQTWLIAIIGALLALYVFMADALRASTGGIEAIRNVLPTNFDWLLFAIALALMAAPVGDMLRGFVKVGDWGLEVGSWRFEIRLMTRD